LAFQDPLRAALNGYGPDERNRLLEAVSHQRPELKRLFHSYGVLPEEAEELLEEVMLDVLPKLPSSDVQSLEEWILTLTLQRCIRSKQTKGAPRGTSSTARPRCHRGQWG
jgi:DNA-directed RNA polymerase specialized sigma24 family protein